MILNKLYPYFSLYSTHLLYSVHNRTNSMWFGGPSLVIPIRRVRQSSVTGLLAQLAPTTTLLWPALRSIDIRKKKISHPACSIAALIFTLARIIIE